MKKNFPFIAILAFATVFMFFSFRSLQQKSQTQEPTPPVCSSITASVLNQMMGKENKIAATFYPIKKTGDMKVKDIDAIFFFGESVETQKKKISRSTFEKQVGYYFQYMKKHHVNISKLSYRYMVNFKRKSLPAKSYSLPVETKTCVCFDPVTGTIIPCPMEPKSLSGEFQISDSAIGKCPPCRLASSLSDFDQIVQKAIQKYQ